VTVFVTLNLSSGVYAQGLVKFDDERKILSSSLQGLMTVLVLVWTAIYLVAHDFWNGLLGLTTVQMLAMMVMIWATAAFGFWANEQRVSYQYKNLVILTFAISLAKPIVGIVFVLLAEDKVTARILGLVLVELVGYTALYVIQMRRGKMFFSTKFWKYALTFNLPLLPHYLSLTVLSGADRIMIKSMVGESEAGIYSLAYSVSLIMTLFNTSLMQTVSPWIYQKIKSKNITDIAPIAYMTMSAIAGVNLLLIVFAPEIVAIFAPSSYYEAIYVIPPVAMSVYFMFSYDLFAKFAFYYEKTKFIMIASVIGGVLNIVLNYIFIGLCGYKAAGYTTLACYMIYCFGHYIFMRMVCRQCCDGIMPYDTKKIVGVTGVFLFAGFGLLFTYDYPVIRYGVIIVVMVIAFIKRKMIVGIVKKIMVVKK